VSKHALELSANPLDDLTPERELAFETGPEPELASEPESEFGAGARARSPARPENLRRSVFHVLWGLAAVALIRFLPGREWLIGLGGTAAVCAWTAEITRRRNPAINARMMRLFAPIAHPHEHHEVNSSTWYTTALLLLGLFAPLRAAEIGVLILGFADPAAGFVGRRWGRTRIRPGRSLEGTLGFVAVGTLAASVWLAAVNGMSPGPAVLVALVGAIVGAIAEIVLMPMDDNFTIPVAATAAVAIALALV